MKSANKSRYEGSLADAFYYYTSKAMSNRYDWATIGLMPL